MKSFQVCGHPGMHWWLAGVVIVSGSLFLAEREGIRNLLMVVITYRINYQEEYLSYYYLVDVCACSREVVYYLNFFPPHFI